MTDVLDPPRYEQPPLDPGFATFMEQNKQADIDAMQVRLQGDTAGLLARYGTQLALAGSIGGSPLMSDIAPLTPRPPSKLAA